MRRREFLKYICTSSVALCTANMYCGAKTSGGSRQPNILICMSDNQFYSHLSCYGDKVVSTPYIDKIADKGVRFTNAYCSSPSCSPARAGFLTGQEIWRLEEAANLWGTFPQEFAVYTDLLRNAGYSVGYEGKGWGPGSLEDSGRESDPSGKEYESFESFLDVNNDSKPWAFWFGSTDPHRPYDAGSGLASGMDMEKVSVPAYLPDCETVRSDICDYYFEIERFDAEVGKIVGQLESSGQLEDTIIVICADNGWQMPRGLANLYDSGVRVPLIISWPGQINGSRVVSDFVNLNDLAPTFLELAGLDAPASMTGQSLCKILFSGKSGRVEKERDFVVTARERHAWCREGGLGYPARAIRTDDYLYIRNYEPQRWPAGDPPLFGDIDPVRMHYYGPTKEYMMSHKDDPWVRRLYELAFLKRPAEELYDLKTDPYQINNVAGEKEYEQIKQRLSKRMNNYLKSTGDPRALGKKDKIIWDDAKYYREKVKIAHPRKGAIEKFNLKKEYDFR